MYRFFLTYLFSFIISICIGANIDSLKLQLQNNYDICTLNKIAKAYSRIHPDSCMLYSNLAYSASLNNDDLHNKGLAQFYIGYSYKRKMEYDNALIYLKQSVITRKKSNDILGLSKSLNNIADIYRTLGADEKAISYYKNSLEIKKQLEDHKGAGIALIGIANTHLMNDCYDKALKSYQLALGMFEKVDSKLGIASCYNNLGIIHENWEDFDEAISYYQKSLELEKQMNNLKGIANNYNNQGNVYSKKGDLKKALSCYLYALEKRKEINDSIEVAGAYNNIAIVHELEKDYKKAIEYVDISMSINRSIKSEYNLAINYSLLASIYNHKSNYTIAKAYIDSSMSISRRLGIKRIIHENYSTLSNVYENQNDYKNALLTYKNYILVRDSIFSNENLKKINELINRHKIEQKEQEITLLTKENEINALKVNRTQYTLIAVSLITLLSVIILLLIIQRNKFKSKQKEAILSQKLFRVQMNPHFVFNSLSSIQGFILKQDSKRAVTFISKLAKLIRIILENSRIEFIPFEKEIETLEHYLTLQQIRFSDKFDFIINIDPSVERENIKIPPMMAQPFIENSIEHGISNMSEKGLISISYTQENDIIKFEIEDNGIGLDAASEQKRIKAKEHKSLATSITRERLALYFKDKVQRVSITDISIDSPRQHGTRVTVYMPTQNISK